MKKDLPQTRQIGWQMYRRVGFRDHFLANGEYVELVRCEALCATCGRPFESAATKTDWRHSRLTRRCERHRARGVPVDGLKAPVLRSRMPAWAWPDQKVIEATAAKKRYSKSPAQRKSKKPTQYSAIAPARPSYLD